MLFPELGNEPFHDAGDIIVASDTQASRSFVFVRRNSAGNVEMLSRRDGPVDQVYSLRECNETGPIWRYLAEGESIVELAANWAKHPSAQFSGVLVDSIADVTVRHALAAMREIELKGGK